MDFTYPPKDEMRVRIEKIKNLCEKEKDSFLARMFASPDPHDKTVVFDYIDDEWIDTVHGKIQSVAESSMYNGDGTVEHRIAYICVDINTAHRFGNGNKRSSLLTLLLLLIYNDMWERIRMTNDTDIYNLAKKIAREGSAGRDNNIIALRECLKHGNFKKCTEI